MTIIFGCAVGRGHTFGDRAGDTPHRIAYLDRRWPPLSVSTPSNAAVPMDVMRQIAEQRPRRRHTKMPKVKLRPLLGTDVISG
jgi:hypothetical protein